MKTLKVTSETPVRINKYLSEQGLVSRRNADTLIEEGNITINGKIAVLGSKVKKGDTVTVKQVATSPMYALYYKPRGEVTGRLSALPGCEPIGRLDKESEGLMLYTNDYRVSEAVLHPNNKREKEYEVQIREKATPRVVTILKRGIYTQEASYEPVKHVEIYNEGHSLRIIITEGKKHEIRRMLNALNLTVLSLKRVRIMSFVYHGLKPGSIHPLSARQVHTLLSEIGLAD